MRGRRTAQHRHGRGWQGLATWGGRRRRQRSPPHAGSETDTGTETGRWHLQKKQSEGEAKRDNSSGSQGKKVKARTQV